jgi:hypothetical protein
LKVGVHVLENGNRIASENNYDILQYTYDTFMAFVDIIIPRTPLIAQLYGEIMYYGALDLYTDEYLVMMLNYYTLPISYETAVMLNILAKKYMNLQGRRESNLVQQELLFAELSPVDRFLSLTILDNSEAYLTDEPPINKYPELISITSSLVRFTMLGFYSEWFGYGSTRLAEPNQRILEFIPISWYQVSYPGKSLSYITEINNYYTIRNQSNVSI